ncbi:hypothetical protein DFJ58DRAFT_792403 [Suillus subalutaceus]|uniref:uncharacterized protein n=1 Tax=Suillus subalutaceus TaxID=48586 RepID=UPI001B861762|nr:uncharacterized protein DFJ58DRAFT_792403 [Suillus subalutaceus]KAG1851619.1 hypothetical protein DFJ58DRAFT_792403 [Suillus subalutaceus]
MLSARHTLLVMVTSTSTQLQLLPPWSLGSSGFAMTLNSFRRLTSRTPGSQMGCFRDPPIYMALESGCSLC